MTRLSDKILVSHFVFLELAIFCKLIVMSIYLGYAIGVIDEIPVTINRIIYNASFVYLYVACSLGLYKWLIIIIRAKYYGGYLSQRTYKARIRKSKIWFIIVATIIPVVNLLLIFVDAFIDSGSLGQTINLVTVIISSSVAMSFIVIGSILVRRLYVFFRRTYNK